VDTGAVNRELDGSGGRASGRGGPTASGRDLQRWRRTAAPPGGGGCGGRCSPLSHDSRLRKALLLPTGDRCRGPVSTGRVRCAVSCASRLGREEASRSR
jgi:hypothetical protein